mmetsp:Transcript_50872/g.164620  ORF Transcript_50872/g.164620 Transcript_50872/m.164620 type:complete len:855 (+) Transcript_50872:914-3478(+)
MGQLVELVAQTHQGPVLEGEVREERLALADVHDVLHAEDVEVVVPVEVDRGVVLLGSLGLLLLLRRLLLILLFLLLLLLLRLGRGHLLLLLHGLIGLFARSALLLLLFLLAALGLLLLGLLLGFSFGLLLGLLGQLLRRLLGLLLGLLLSRHSGQLGLLKGLGRDLCRGLALLGHRSHPDRLLPLVLLRAPPVYLRLELAILLLETVARLEVLDARRELLVQQPVLDVLGALGLLRPLIPDLLETLLLGGDGEVGEASAQLPGAQVGDDLLPEEDLLLLICEGDLGRLLLLGLLHLLILLFFLFLLFLVLLGLLLLIFFLLFLGLLALLLLFSGSSSGCNSSSSSLSSLLGLIVLRLLGALHGSLGLLVLLLDFPLALLELPLLRLLKLMNLELLVGLLLLLLQQQFVRFGLEGRIRLAHHDHGHLLTMVQGEALRQGLAVILDEIGLHLHDDEVPLQHRRDRLQNLADCEVVQRLHTKLHARLVVGGLPVVALLPEEAALLGPAQDHALAQLGVVGVLLQPHVQPIEGALVRQEARENHLVLTVLRLGCRQHLGISNGGILDHPARERQLGHGLGSEVDLDRQVPVGHCREKGLALQCLGQLLGLAHADTIPEEADGVRVRAAVVEVDDYGVDLLAGKSRHRHGRALGAGVLAVGVEADAVLGVAEEQARSLRGQTDLQDGARAAALAVPGGLGGIQDLQDFDLEHVSAALHPNVAARPGEEVLKAAVGQRHENVAMHRREHIQRRVARQEGHHLADLLTLGRRRVLLELLRGLGGLGRLGCCRRRLGAWGLCLAHALTVHGHIFLLTAGCGGGIRLRRGRRCRRCHGCLGGGGLLHGGRGSGRGGGLYLSHC